MPPKQQLIKEYLTFTKKDRVGIICLLLILTVVIFLPSFFRSSGTPPLINSDTAWVNAMQKLVLNNDSNKYVGVPTEDASDYQYQPSTENYRTEIKGELFYFDPNTLTPDGWKRLGLRDKTIQTIQKYVSKGGHFIKPEDLQRIYGLRKFEYERLLPFIRITEQGFVKSGMPNTANNFTTPSNIGSISNKKKYEIIDINSADTTAFISLPGIGSKLAARIVNFRNKLGGFYTIDQVGETYGVPDSTFQLIKPYLKVTATDIKKISINSATKDDLKIHPYIKWNLANAIVEYRNQHGNYKSLADLKNIALIDEGTYKKIEAYLSIQ